jgi:hypothetical protein
MKENFQWRQVSNELLHPLLKWNWTFQGDNQTSFVKHICRLTFCCYRRIQIYFVEDYTNSTSRSYLLQCNFLIDVVTQVEKTKITVESKDTKIIKIHPEIEVLHFNQFFHPHMTDKSNDIVHIYFSRRISLKRS